jgi:integrase
MITSSNLLTDYVQRKSPGTVAAQLRDLALFASFLCKHNYTNKINAFALQTQAETWSKITWRAIQHFVDQQIEDGSAISSINRRLSTIKNYAKLAAKSGVLDAGEFALITTIASYSSNEAKRLDENHNITRVSKKKISSVRITQEQAVQLKDQPSTSQGRRDQLLMCLLLEHGLRVSEMVLLQAKHFDLETGLFYFERPNVDGEQIHQLTRETLLALQAYIHAGDCPQEGALLRGSLKSGALTHAGISDRAVQARVRFLGEQIGLFGLSPHDCRHYWATYWATKVDVLRLQEAGGWSSLEMPRRYVERSRIANIGMTKD